MNDKRRGAGAILKAWRTRHNLSLRAAAPRFGISFQHLAKLEAEEAVPSLELAIVLQEEVGVPAPLWVKRPEAA